MNLLEKFAIPVCVTAFLALTPDVVFAQNCDRNPDHPKCSTDPGPDTGTDPGTGLTPTYFDWMHPDIGDAFAAGYTGVGSHLVILDNFSGTGIDGNLDGTWQSLSHGDWTSLQSRLVAPEASYVNVDQPSGRRDRSGVISDYFSADAGLQVVNMSFGLFEPEGTTVDAGYSFGFSIWDSLVDEAFNPNGQAVLVKAAGNLYGQAVDTGTMMIGFPFSSPHVDTLNLSLINAPNALYVGALDGNTIADYSTIAGPNTDIQDMYLVANVRDDLTGLAGTSFAAPLVSGYAALVGDKYYETLAADPNPAALVVDRLLETARTDTISDFGASCTLFADGACTRSSVYGVGEASLANALAPNAIPN